MARLTPAARVACFFAERDAEDGAFAALEAEHVVMGLCRAREFRAFGIGDFPVLEPPELEDLRREAQAFTAAAHDGGLDLLRLKLRLRDLCFEAHPERTVYSGQRSPACHEAFDRAGALARGDIGLFALAQVFMTDPAPMVARALSEQQVDAPRLQGELARGLAAARWPRLRCSRCGWAYDEAGNGETACAFHSGRLRDYNSLSAAAIGAPGDFWECCMRQIQDHEPALALPGCATGRHVEAAPDDSGPVRRALDEDLRITRRLGTWPPPPAEQVAAAREHVRRFLDAETKDAADDAGTLREDTLLIGREDFSWLLRQLMGAAPAGERSRRIAGFIADRQDAELIRRATAPEARP